MNFSKVFKLDWFNQSSLLRGERGFAEAETLIDWMLAIEVRETGRADENRSGASFQFK